MSSLGARVRGIATRGAALAAVLLVAATAFAQETAPGMSEFTPVNSLPAAQRMPDGPLFVAAYAVVWVALLLFLWAIWRRLAKVDGELRRVESSRPSKGGRD